MNQLRTAAMDSFFKIPRGGLEIGGVLFGVCEPRRVRIQAFRILACEHLSGPSFVLSDADRAALCSLLASARMDGLHPVGWFRSRTRSEISLSEADVALFDSYFPDPLHVVLVLRPEVTNPTRAGFFFRQEDGTVQTDSSQGEFEVENEAPLPLPLPAPEQALLTASTPGWSWRPFWICATSLMLTAAAALAARDYLDRKPPAPAQLSLQALDRRGQLQFQWDRTAHAVLQARGARVEITDGPARFSADLDAAQLQHGSFYYARQTGRVDFHLIVFETGAASTDEYAIFYAPPDVTPSE